MENEITIIRGEAFPLEFKLTYGGMPLTPSNVTKMEVTLGPTIDKEYPDGGVSYDSTNLNWMLDITQEMSYNLTPGVYHLMANVKVSGTRTVCVAASIAEVHVVISDFKKTL